MPSLKDVGSLTALLLAAGQNKPSEDDLYQEPVPPEEPYVCGYSADTPVPAPHALPWRSADNAVLVANGWPYGSPLGPTVKDVIVATKNNADLMTVAAFLVKETPHYLQVRFDPQQKEVTWI